MTRSLTLMLAAAGAATAPQVAHASALFQFLPTAGQQQVLIINGTTQIVATHSGWWNDAGTRSGNMTGPNPRPISAYIVGRANDNSTPPVSNDYRNYFSFDLSGFNEPITSAVLSIGNRPNGYSGEPLATWSVWDVSTSFEALTVSSSSYTPSTAIYGDLGTGMNFGYRTVSAADNGTQVNLTLNAAALTALRGSLGGRYNIGGRLDDGRVTFDNPTPAPAVPEPSTWASLILGFAVVGGSLRRRRSAPVHVRA